MAYLWGTVCAPLLANLRRLILLEYNYMKNLMKLDYGKALRFNFTGRYIYIDDLLTLNNTFFVLVLNRALESDVDVSYVFRY